MQKEIPMLCIKTWGFSCFLGAISWWGDINLICIGFSTFLIYNDIRRWIKLWKFSLGYFADKGWLCIVQTRHHKDIPPASGIWSAPGCDILQNQYAHTGTAQQHDESGFQAYTVGCREPIVDTIWYILGFPKWVNNCRTHRVYASSRGCIQSQVWYCPLQKHQPLRT